MAVTVTTDLITRHAHDAITNALGVGGVQAPTAVDTTILVQGTGSNRCRHNATGLGGVTGDYTNADISKLHVAVWVNVLDKADTKANGGWRIRLAANGAAATNFGETTVGGNDTQVMTNKGFAIFCVDPNRPFDFVTGTPAALTGIGSIAAIINALSASTRETWFSDAYVTFTSITIKGGTGGDPGKSVQIASNDNTNGRGIFQNVVGAYYILGGIVIGDTAASSEFADSNEVWIFQDQPVSATFHRIEFIGDAGAGVNNAKFGTKIGTGTTAEGAGGNAFKATGLSPFSIKAIDANVTVGLYGCIFTNPVALMEDAPRAYQYATAADAFTNQTRQAGNTTANDHLYMPATEAVNDKCVIGHDEPFSQVKITVGTAGVGGVVAWEYYNGSAWVALTDVTDSTNSFKTAGTSTVTFAVPSDWATTTLGSIGPYYYIRARVTTTYSTNPNGTQVKCVMGGRIRWEQANAEAIRCTFTNMDTIVVRNSAVIKKCVISNSVAPAKSAALDLGASDPAADTIRDLQIQNCINGILLRPTATSTYNFRNIKFSNNTNDVRIDAPAGATVTINVLEGGSTPTTQNVNGSTIVINNSVNLKVKVLDEAGVAIQSAQVGIFKTDGTQLMNEATIADGTATESFNFTADTAVKVRVRKAAGGSTDYIPVDSPQTITSAGLDITITLTTDDVNSN